MLFFIFVFLKAFSAFRKLNSVIFSCMHKDGLVVIWHLALLLNTSKNPSVLWKEDTDYFYQWFKLNIWLLCLQLSLLKYLFVFDINLLLFTSSLVFNIFICLTQNLKAARFRCGKLIGKRLSSVQFIAICLEQLFCSSLPIRMKRNMVDFSRCLWKLLLMFKLTIKKGHKAPIFNFSHWS